MTRRVRVRRPAFTLVELMIAMAVIVILSSLALLIVPDVLDKDRTTDAAALTRQWLMIAKARAARDKENRGVRLVTALDPQNPAKTSLTWVTELQYIEQPPPYQPNPSGSPFLANGDIAPYVVFLMDGTGKVFCEIRNLTLADATLILTPPNQGLKLTLPSLSMEYLILSAAIAPPQSTQPAFNTTGANSTHLSVTLFPSPGSQQLGASGPPPGTLTQMAVRGPDTAFGVNVPPRPLLGEPPLQLPKNICIDITPLNPTGSPQPVPFNQAPSSPAFNPGPPPKDYDILFTPKGYVAAYSAGAAGGTIFLWVRDYTKTASPLVVLNPSPLTLDMTPFQNGGEQQVIALKTSAGSMWTAPVMWPNANGQYTSPQPNPWYDFARNGQ